LGQAPDERWAWVARLSGSLFTAAFSTLSLAIMGDVLEERSQSEVDGHKRRGRSMGLYRGIGSLAFAAGALIGGRLADAYSLRFIFVVCGGLYMASGLCAIALREFRLPFSDLPEPNPKEGDAAGSAGRPVLATHLPYLFLAGVVLWTMAHSASASMWPNFMDRLGYTKTAISSLWGLAALIEMPAMYFAGILSDVTGRAIVLALGGFGIALTNFGYLSVAQFFPALLGVQVLRGFGFGSYTTSSMTFTAEFGGQRMRGRTSGLFNTASSAGQLLGSLFGGTLAQAQGFTFMFGFCALSALASGICFLALRRRTHRQEQRAAYAGEAQG
jgi:MFS family permease